MSPRQRPAHRCCPFQHRVEHWIIHQLVDGPVTSTEILARAAETDGNPDAARLLATEALANTIFAGLVDRHTPDTYSLTADGTTYYLRRL